MELAEYFDELSDLKESNRYYKLVIEVLEDYKEEYE